MATLDRIASIMQFRTTPGGTGRMRNSTFLSHYAPWDKRSETMLRTRKMPRDSTDSSIEASRSTSSRKFIRDNVQDGAMGICDRHLVQGHHQWRVEKTIDQEHQSSSHPCRKISQ